MHLLQSAFELLALLAALVDHVGVGLPDFIGGGARTALSFGRGPFVSG